jgi:group I intron endonuclease
LWDSLLLDGIFIMIGIYKITSPTNKIYIGQSINIYKRWNYHKKIYKNKKSKLYSSFLKHGVEKHDFKIIALCLAEDLNEVEKYYIDLYQTFNNKNGLNLRDGGGSKGKMSEETKVKISKSTKGKLGKKKTLEQKKAQSERQKGKIISKETKKKMSLVKKGKLKSNITKGKMSFYSKNRSNTHLENLSKSLTGLIKTKEHCLKISTSNKGKTPHNKGISKYNFNLNEILLELKKFSCISISKKYGCNESVLRKFILNNTGKNISDWKSIKEKKVTIKLPF